MTFTHSWTDDCGEIAIHWMAYHTYPYMYRCTDTDFDALFLIRMDRSNKNGLDAYEWWVFDTQFTLEDYIDDN